MSELLSRAFFDMSEDIGPFCGWRAQSGKEIGVLEGSFGKAGKCKVVFKDGTSLPIGAPFTLRQI